MLKKFFNPSTEDINSSLVDYIYSEAAAKSVATTIKAHPSFLNEKFKSIVHAKELISSWGFELPEQALERFFYEKLKADYDAAVKAGKIKA